MSPCRAAVWRRAAVLAVVLALALVATHACTPPANWQALSTTARTQSAPFVVLARVNHTWETGNATTGVAARLDVRCAFKPFRITFASGSLIDGRRAVGAMLPQYVDVAGFGDIEDCKSTVVPGVSYLFFLSNVTGEAGWGSFEMGARYDDLFGATATVDDANVKNIMVETAPEGHDCGVEADVGWTGECVGTSYRVPNGWTGRHGTTGCICSCWDSFFFCQAQSSLCRPPVSAAPPGTSRPLWLATVVAVSVAAFTLAIA